VAERLQEIAEEAKELGGENHETNQRHD
jgi:hypothetical protein